MYDYDLERLILCDFLFHNGNFEHPDSAFPMEAFYSEQHRDVFKQMRAMYLRHGTVDYPSLLMELRSLEKTQLILEVLIPCLGVKDSYDPECAYMPIHVETLLKMFVKRERDKAILKFRQDIKDGTDAIDAQMELDTMLMVLNSYILDIDQDDIESIADELEQDFLATGYYDLDREINGLASPGLNIIAARPSVGKSAFARGIIGHVSKKKKVYWYSQDQSRAQIYKLEATKAGLNTEALSREEKVKFIERVQRQQWHNNVELVDKPLPIGQLISNVKLSNPDVLVIDYLQIVRSGEADEYDRVTRVCMELKTLALQMKIPVIALAQFNRQYKQGETPDMSWLRGSGQIEQDADMILALERDTADLSQFTDAYVYVLKNKVGKRAKVRLQWARDSAAYRNSQHVSQPYAN